MLHVCQYFLPTEVTFPVLHWDIHWVGEGGVSYIEILFIEQTNVLSQFLSEEALVGYLFDDDVGQTFEIISYSHNTNIDWQRLSRPSAGYLIENTRTYEYVSNKTNGAQFTFRRPY